MIHVNVTRNDQNQIDSISITGHANYANKGEDIVCAAVSGISFGLINSVEMLLNQTLDVEMDEKEEGYLRCRVPHDLSEEVRDKVLLLMEAMVASLQTISEGYGDFLRIHDLNQPGGEHND